MAGKGLDDIKNETVDLEKIPIEEVFEQLKCTRQGLTTSEGESRLAIFGPNKLEEKKESKILKFLGFMWNPLSWVMEAAALMAIVLANGDGQPPDWQDFLGIVVLLVINSTISFIEENNAGNAAAALMAGLAPKTKVLRDGTWSEQEAAILVPGDIVSIKLGDIVPADARLLEGDPLKIDQSALTGESLPVTREPGSEVFSGSTCKQGEIDAVVIATGVHTFFGKAAHLVDSTNNVGHFQKVLTAIGNFCIVSIAIGILIEIIVMWPIQRRKYRDGIDNLLVLLIGGIPIAMPTVLSVTMAIGSHKLAEQGAITKRMTAIEELAGMDVLCSDKTGTLTLNKLSVDKNLIEVFARGADKDLVVLLSARASRTENMDAIDTAMVGMLADPKEARANIQEVHFLPFNPVDKRTALTYIDDKGNWHRCSKGAPEQIMTLCNCKPDIRAKIHAVIDKYAERGLRSLGVGRQEVPEKNKDSPGGPWQFVGVLPLFDPPRHDSAETIRRALELGVNVKMITGDQLAIGKETGRRLGMGTNMYPSSSLLGDHKDPDLGTIPIDELIEKADGFAGVFPEHKYEIVKRLQDRKHICGMTGDGVNDAPALKKADIGIAVADATDAARGASDIVLTEPGLSVIISAVLTSRCIFQRMKNYTIYAVSITIRIVLGFLLIALIWKFDFSPFMVLIIAILNDGTIMTISKDRVKPSPLPDSWKLKEIFATGVILGGYMAVMTVVFFWIMDGTNFFSDKFGVRSIRDSRDEKMGALYLQVSIISQALIFVTRSRSWSFVERPGLLLVTAFIIAQMCATFIAVYAVVGITTPLLPSLEPNDQLRASTIHVHSKTPSGSMAKQLYPNTNSANDSISESQAQLRNGRTRVDSRTRTHLLPRYWPRITDQELQQISGDSNSVITPLFEKMLSASDAGRIGRLVLPKKCAEAYFPAIYQPEGLPLKVQDSTGKEWIFQFRFWPNNNSRMYVLEGVTPCIQSMQLQAGDIVTFSRIDPVGKLVMGFRKASNTQNEQALKSGNGFSSTSETSNGNNKHDRTTLSKNDKAEFIKKERPVSKCHLLPLPVPSCSCCRLFRCLLPSNNLLFTTTLVWIWTAIMVAALLFPK